MGGTGIANELLTNVGYSSESDAEALSCPSTLFFEGVAALSPGSLPVNTGEIGMGVADLLDTLLRLVGASEIG